MAENLKRNVFSKNILKELVEENLTLEFHLNEGGAYFTVKSLNPVRTFKFTSTVALSGYLKFIRDLRYINEKLSELEGLNKKVVENLRDIAENLIRGYENRY